MPPVPAETFAREFRALPAPARAEFVADLWEAQGWETTVEDGVVVAERGGDRRRIGVVDPGRFGTPDLSGLDTLVVARDRDAVDDAARAAGVAYISPEDLREQLLYGVEREVAAELYERHVGEPLVRSIADADESESGTLLPAVQPFEPSRRTLAVIVIIALVGVAALGPTVPGTGPERTPITVTDVGTVDGTVGAVGVASPTPSEGPAVAPGLSLDGVEGGMTLADAHVAGVRNRSRIRSTRLVGPPNGSMMSGLSRQNTTTWIANDSHFYRRASAVGGVAGPGGSVEVELYARGGPVYQRYVVENETQYTQYAPGEQSATAYDAAVQSSLYRYFVGAENSVVSCRIEYDTDCPTYEVTVEDPPDVLGEEVADYNAFMFVSENGVITTMRVRYTLPDADGDGEREPVRFALDYRFADVSPEAPDWLPAAKNATATPTA